MGIRRGWNGLMHGDMYEMNLRSVSNIINRGGTILYSARSPEFKTEEGLRKAVRTCQEHGIEGVVVIVGDGSFRGARDLSERGIPCVGGASPPLVNTAIVFIIMSSYIII